MQYFYPKLLENKEIVCPSPKVRRLIYKELEKNKINFTTEFVGYTTEEGRQSTCGRQLLNYNFVNGKFILSLINHDRILRSSLVEYENFMNNFEKEKIDLIFDKNADFNQRLEYINQQLKYGYKQWSFVPVFKPIKKIIIL